uniref:Uncharacterized protein n=1 Tax=Aegilops tauschii subsp. strangulata TaxID=200361 RepID=A0A453KSZ0_AEGTS
IRITDSKGTIWEAESDSDSSRRAHEGTTKRVVIKRGS